MKQNSTIIIIVRGGMNVGQCADSTNNENNEIFLIIFSSH